MILRLSNSLWWFVSSLDSMLKKVRRAGLIPGLSLQCPRINSAAANFPAFQLSSFGHKIADRPRESWNIRRNPFCEKEVSFQILKFPSGCQSQVKIPSLSRWPYKV
ncbi:hypothetical protein TWF506_004304 [Arthrobotrys conoides]|uniref:Uncharacterized protein n=1 Tax=Arthrobotrys conoides TaxID=74498 RepID=A0AAN8N2H2_9PEZI